MTIPPGPVTIMGIPYGVRECDRPDREDPNYTFIIDREGGEIRVLDSVADGVKRFSIMQSIILEARQLLDPGHPVDEKQDDSMAQALLGSLRTNPDLVQYLTGETDKMPKTLQLLGALWTVSPVDVIPGQRIECAGLCQ